MNVILLVVTGASLALAGFMSAVAWRMTREERRRADTRVAALADALYDDGADKSQVVAHLLDAGRTPDWKQRAIALGSGVAAVVIAASLMAVPARVLGSRSETRSAKASRSDGNSATHDRTATNDRSARLQPSDAPLELIALEHERAGEDLVVRGLVRNPPDAAERDGLSAVVSVLGTGGEVVATVRAALPTARLTPGATTPFVVNVTGAADVDRFRLSFRTDTRVEPHVDRRK